MTFRAKLAWLCRQQITVNDYLIVSSILSIYLQVPLFASVPTSFIGYGIVLPNFFILLARRQIVAQPVHALYILLLTAVGLLGTHLSGAPPQLVATQVMGISFFSVYYYSLLAHTGIPLQRVMDLYARSAVGIVVLAFVMQALGLRVGLDPRMHGILPEPSMFVITTLPAIAYYMFKARKGKRNLAVLSLFAAAYILSGSTLGLMGFAMVLVIAFGSRSAKYIPIAIAVVAAAFVGFYSVSSNVRVRVDDTLRGSLTSDTGKVNFSTIALLTNMQVAAQSFRTQPLIGIGFGAHRVAHDRFIADLIPEGQEELPAGFHMNGDDASSMLLRVGSELGLFGLGSVALFFIIFCRVRGRDHVMLRNMLLPYFALKLLRYGHYFPMEFFFFLMLFVVNYLEYRRGAQRSPASIAAGDGKMTIRNSAAPTPAFP